MRQKKSLKQKCFALFLLGFFSFFYSISIAQEEKQKEKEKQKTITEEIIVEAQLPKETPFSTTSLIKREKIDSFSPKDLSEVLSYTSGTFVSCGSKNEFSIKIRGLGSQRIALLYDGIPIYEPYFNSFDLKTIAAEGVESIKIVKGASSVLYGPNTLGGIVNIITRRQNPPSFSLKSQLEGKNTYSISSSGAFSWKSIFFSGSVFYDKSDGFRCNKNGENILRDNSDYDRKNIMGKVYFYPSQKSEILAEVAYYTSEYGIPAATEYYKSRYWRFKNWNRLQFNIGGTFSLLKNGSLKFRSYYVRHDNVLDAYSSAEMSTQRWESTYKNYSYGAFLLGSVPYLSHNELKFSLNMRNDNVQTQDDVGKEWEDFEHKTVSIGIENHFSLNQKWKLVAGASLDYLKKNFRADKTTINPILGIKFNPQNYIDFHVTFSQKSRFPSMKSLYSTSLGNPDLKDERGTNYEFGFTYERSIFFSGAIFYNRISDLIKGVRNPDGSHTNYNIGKAQIFGFELEFQKTLAWLNLSLNYTYLDGKDKDENRPLEELPKNQLNFSLQITAKHKIRFMLFGFAVSHSEIKLSDNIIKIPGYFITNAILSKDFSNLSIFFKAENLFNNYYYSNMGFPMKARTISAGLKLNIGRNL